MFHAKAIKKIELEARAHRPSDMTMDEFVQALRDLGNEVVRVEGDDVIVAVATKHFTQGDQ